jgi:PAS domain S-box-containing protein
LKSANSEGTTIAKLRRGKVRRREGNGDTFREVVANMRDYAIFLMDPEGYIRTWNLGAQRIKGYTEDEIVGQHFSIFYPPEANARNWPATELMTASAEGRFEDEGWRVRKDGSTFWATVVITALRDDSGKLIGFSKVTRDITERRQREEKIEQLNRDLQLKVNELSESQQVIGARTADLHNLSTRLLRVQDEERRRIARELHDELGQDLAALKMSLETFARGKGGSLSESVRAVSKAIEYVRNLSYLLHPPLLDEVGLQAAVQWIVEGFQKRSNIQTTFRASPTKFPRLSTEMETTIFRLIQESLTNIYRHSGSKDAVVELKSEPNEVTIRIRDYGKGLAVDILRPGMVQMGVGIGGMRERVEQFGGELKLVACEPGLMVAAKIPMGSGSNASATNGGEAQSKASRFEETVLSQRPAENSDAP